MNVVYAGPGLIEVLLFVAGLVAGILLRRRDGKAALLVTIGFGVQILGAVLAFVEGLVLPALIHGAGAGSLALSYGVSVVLRLLTLAAFVLIFLGLLRLVRRRPAAAPGVAR